MSKKRPWGCPAFRPSPWVLESPSGGCWAENGRQEGQQIYKLNKNEQFKMHAKIDAEKEPKSMLQGSKRMPKWIQKSKMMYTF